MKALCLYLGCLLSLASGHETDVKYVGCVRDTHDRLLKGYHENFRSQTHKHCVEVCKARYFSYAGVQYRSHCFCGNTRPPTEYVVSESECNMKCRGNATQMCGGVWRMNVFETGFTGEGPAYKHIGCVKDIGTRLMKGYRGEYPRILNRRFCVQECVNRGFPYAGVQYGRWCYCDFHKPPFEHFIGEEQCNMKCQGNQLQMCGGNYKMDVLEIESSGKNQSTGREQQPDSQNSLKKACRLPDYPENTYELFNPSSSASHESAPRPGDAVASGRLVMVSCPDHGQQTGQGFSICSDGVWSQQILRCTSKNQSTGGEQQPDSQNSLKKDCRLPDYPENTYELFNSSARPESAPKPGDAVASGRLVKVSCPDLGQQTGQGFSICSDGVWSQQILHCTKSCPPISSSSGSLECYLGESLVECDQPFSPGSTVTVGCLPVIDVRVNLDEKTNLTCQQSGTWSGLLPACI